MARTKISEFSSTAASNTDIDGINIAEGCSPSGINDAIRELMSQLKDWQAGTSNDPYVIGSSGSLTLNQGTANGVLYLNGSKVVTSGSALTFDGTTLKGGSALGVNTTTFATNSKFVVQTASGKFDVASYGGSSVQIMSDATLAYYVPSISYDHVWFQGVSDAMRLTSTGLGIGTSSPSQKLQVAGNVYVTGDTFRIKNSASNTAFIRAEENASTAAYTYATMDGRSSGYWAFSTNDTERMRLDSSGNLGLGVTPSAWGGYKAFEIGNAGSAVWSSGLTDIRLAANMYYNAGYKYAGTGVASRFELSSGGFYWYQAPSGTAGNAITFTQAMTLDASGRQLVGNTTSVGTAYQTNIQVKGSSSSNYGGLGVVSSNNEMLGVVGVWSSGENSLMIAADPDNLRASSSIVFTTDGSERARIDSSGNLLVGTTGTSWTTTAGFYAFYQSAVNATRDGAEAMNLNRLTSDGIILGFRRSGTQVGSVSVTTTATAYNTSSDYRLKNSVAPMTGALARVAQLKPVTYKWNADGSDGEGFIAHELAEVCPHAVVGAKDAIDEDGNPKYQGIDTSFLVATLTAAIQEQQAIIESLKARLDAANL